MRYNTCCTARSFDDPDWMAVFEEFHRDLREPAYSKGIPDPSIFVEYRNRIWRGDTKQSSLTLLSADNLIQCHRIWEYVQTCAAIYHALSGNLAKRRIIGLGAGVESPLWTLARWGADVTAADIYYERKYWHPEWVPFIRKDPDVFCPYRTASPVRFTNLNAKIRSLQGFLQWHKLGTYDVIYSISSLEHIHGVQRREPRMPRPIMRSKIAMFRRIARHVAAGGILSFTTELIVTRGERRRVDFYERSDLEEIVATLDMCGLKLIDTIDWETDVERAIPTRGMEGCTHTALSLTFRRTP